MLGNAREFLPPPLVSRDHIKVEQHLHMVAVSVELALKAALLAAGDSDYENRVFVGHDLVEAADRAADRGLTVSRPVRALIDVLHPYYMKGGFHGPARRTWPRIARRARAITAALIDEVGRAIEAGTLKPWSGPPRAGLASTLAVLALAAYLPSVRAVFFGRAADFEARDRWFVRAIQDLPIAARGVYLFSSRAKLSQSMIARLTFMNIRRVRAQLAGALLSLRFAHIDEGEPPLDR